MDGKGTIIFDNEVNNSVMNKVFSLVWTVEDISDVQDPHNVNLATQEDEVVLKEIKVDEITRHFQQLNQNHSTVPL